MKNYYRWPNKKCTVEHDTGLQYNLVSHSLDMITISYVSHWVDVYIAVIDEYKIANDIGENFGMKKCRNPFQILMKLLNKNKRFS